MSILARFTPHLIVLLVILIAIAKIDANGYARAEADAEKRKAELRQFTAELNGQLDEQLAALEQRTQSRIAKINREDRTIVQPIIQSELAKDPSLASRVCLTPELQRAVNVSRGHPARAAAEDLGTSPAVVPGSTAAR